MIISPHLFRGAEFFVDLCCREWYNTVNANGIRTSKTVNGVKHTYTLDGTKILCEAWGGNTLVPLYDNGEGICGIVYNDEPFYFQKNLQSDIIGIVDKNAHTVARYSYDAWGACTVVADTSECSVAAVNPFRYRGYYFDVDTSLYYLQSRYYLCVKTVPKPQKP